jgi:citrate synthase
MPSNASSAVSSPSTSSREPSSREPAAPALAPVHEGLAGVVATETRLSRVEGEVGRLTIAGYDVADIAPRLPFEALAFLLLEDRLPSDPELQQFRRAIAASRGLGAATLSLLTEAARHAVGPMHALRLGVASLVGEPRSPHRVLADVEEGRSAECPIAPASTFPSPAQGVVDAELTPIRLLGALPSIAAAYARLLAGQAPLAPDPSLSASESFLYGATGRRPTARQARALDTYWNTVADHGLNASTFAARVIASTGGTLGAAVEGAIGALEGPLHGGAPGPALDALLALRERGGDLAMQTRDWAEAEIAAGRRLMGFGHRIYKVRDPRALVLERAAEGLLEGSSLLAEARVHEAAVLDVLSRLKPGRGIATNVEFYTALVLHGLGLSTAWFTPTFALGRLAGWLGHIGEQRARGRLIRPESRYVGAERRVL